MRGIKVNDKELLEKILEDTYQQSQRELGGITLLVVSHFLLLTFVGLSIVIFSEIFLSSDKLTQQSKTEFPAWVKMNYDIKTKQIKDSDRQ
jgi:hypothetical protein